MLLTYQNAAVTMTICHRNVLGLPRRFTVTTFIVFDRVESMLLWVNESENGVLEGA